MIGGFACKDTERLYQGQRVRRWPEDLCRVARRKLAQLAVSTALSDLMVPPGNRLEALKGNRKDQHSIRVNDQRRLCFVWKGDSAHDVELVDYH
ncbi:MAG: type II toxin-antitoxin system RelE/ParE family toxin [Planctomycetota bacterium]|nr:MAG: type II toxin-antitoxin system RelE/ParE family toxin [Planctomycetota bacterium]